MSNLLQCNCCGEFGDESEVQVVTLTIHKHQRCSVSSMFGGKNENRKVGGVAIVTGSKNPIPGHFTDDTTTFSSFNSKEAAIIAELEKSIPKQEIKIGQ